MAVAGVENAADFSTDGSIPLIHVRPPGARATLIRPGLQFIEELRKTVENL